MAMAVATPAAGKGGGGGYGATSSLEKTYNNNDATRSSRSSSTGDGGDAVAGRIVMALRAGAAATTFVAVALVASCRHGDWMEFARYHEYRYLLGASAAACVYSAAQALRNFRRMRRGGSGSSSPHAAADFAGDQVVAYLLITASSAALPITLRMRSAVVNVFTDAITAAIGLSFVAFAALALSAIVSGFRIISSAQRPY